MTPANLGLLTHVVLGFTVVFGGLGAVLIVLFFSAVATGGTGAGAFRRRERLRSRRLGLRASRLGPPPTGGLGGTRVRRDDRRPT
ncbi:hypothetical protein [Actinokineospora bangkokensis]|uniref:hypothetical protein n=1 Tax=Actinokineospora bangkokensis TaxID=1193682 RepID=UPI0018EA0C3C|nr:hypothetical protein [Actinokineospora bangkokensis]